MHPEPDGWYMIKFIKISIVWTHSQLRTGRLLLILGTLSNLLSSTLPRYLVFDIEQCISGFGMNLKRYQTGQKIEEAHQCGVLSIIV